MHMHMHRLTCTDSHHPRASSSPPPPPALLPGDPALLPPHISSCKPIGASCPLTPPSPILRIPPLPQAAEHFKDATATCLVQWGNVNIVKVGSGSGGVQGGEGFMGGSLGGGPAQAKEHLFLIPQVWVG